MALSRDLRLMDITMIGVGAMIGAGIFVLTGIAAGAAGPALILSFALNGIVTIFTAMVYAELGSAIPEAGGGYLWVREGLPGPNAFLAGWMSWFAHAVAGSLYALGFGAYLALVFSELHFSIPGLEGELVHKGFAVVIVVTFLYINFRGASETGLAGNIVTVLKIIILMIFVASGIWAIVEHPAYLDKFQNFAPNGMAGILTAMGLTFIAFEGYEIIVQAGEEVKDPRRNIPKAVFLSLAIVVPIYMLVAFVAIGAVNPDTEIPTFQWLAKHAELGVAEAARQFMPFGTLLLLIGGILSTMSALNATTFSSTRVSFAMGRDKNLPDAFAQVHSRRRTPHKALMLSGALIIFVAMAIPIEDVAAAADILFLLLFLQVNIAVITIRKKYGQRLRYSYLMPFFPIVPIIGIVTKLFLALFMFNYSPIAWYFTLVWIGAGSLIYYAYARPREHLKDQTPILLQERRIFEQDDEKYRVLVPIANPESLPILLPPAIKAAREHDGIINLLHVITVPKQVPLSEGRQFIEKSHSLTERALKKVEKEGIPAEVLIRVSHQPAQAIAETVLEKKVDLLVMGWRGQSRTPHVTVGKNVERIIEEVNCDALIVQQDTRPSLMKLIRPSFNKLIVPIEYESQAASGIEKAWLMAGDGKVEIDVVHIFSRKVKREEREEFMAKLQEQIDRFKENKKIEKLSITLQAMEAANPVNTIVEVAREYDCVVLVASRDIWIKRKFFSSKVVQIARRVKPPLVLVRSRASQLGFGVHRVLNFFRGGYADIDPSSEKELQEEGWLRPETEKGEKKLHTSVNKPELFFTGFLGVVSAVLIYWGGGGVWTWIGVVGFFIALALFTWVSIRGTKRRG